VAALGVKVSFTTVPETLSVQSMQQGMSRSVCDTTAAMRLASLAELVGLTAKGALVDLAIGGARKRHA
jgi:hypothetical protein